MDCKMLVTFIALEQSVLQLAGATRRLATARSYATAPCHAMMGQFLSGPSLVGAEASPFDFSNAERAAQRINS